MFRLVHNGARTSTGVLHKGRRPVRLAQYPVALFSTHIKPIKKLLVANRGEIAIRICRAAHELDIASVAVYSKEDTKQLHRQKATESYMLDPTKAPVEAYLNFPQIIQIAQRSGADAIHPGYGFLSERADFAKACEDAGLAFIGPKSDVVAQMGNKTAARELAIKTGVSVVPGTERPVETAEEAKKFIAEIGLPVMLKAAYGGGGRGMRIVRDMKDVKQEFETASSEALTAFGNGSMFIERYVENPRHIEVQVLGDKYGNVVHLYERDCSVQRRYQKVVEIAPAPGISEDLRNRLTDDALKLARACNYSNAGTVEFLVDDQDRHYFIEVNARLQVEHTVTEEVTGIDLVHSQIRVAEGHSLPDIGVSQDTIKLNKNAIQVRVTTEDAEADFRPSTGKIQHYSSAEGMGIRLDAGSGFTGAVISPFYDSLLVKMTASGTSHKQASKKLVRALREMRIQGVTTNIPFLCKVLSHPDFTDDYKVDTSFIAAHPELSVPDKKDDVAAQEYKLMNFIANQAVNGPHTSLGTSMKPSTSYPYAPHEAKAPRPGLRQIYLNEGPKGFAKAVRENKGTLVMDTTWRDAHQSLLATRVRTKDIKTIAPLTAEYFANAYALEMWGGATFDVALRFLRECPWDRLAQLRELVPNIPFSMLLRGANAVGYTGYPENVVQKFCDHAVSTGVDVFRVFDSLNYMPNMRMGMDAVGAAGGIIEAAISYTGDVSDPSRTKYNLDYYLDLTRQLKDAGTHVLCIKDMAGLLKPKAASMLIGAIREEFPDLPVHVHTHDTSGAGVAAMLAASQAGADAVDLAVDSMSGMTSQPSMGAFVAALQGTDLDTGLDLDHVTTLSDYWENARNQYAPFECTVTMRTGGADVYKHEIPGGQYTNLHFQAFSLGLADQWPLIKQKYAEANMLLGDIVKVTPSSKVVGDLAQFMVQNQLSADDVVEKAGELDFPQSVVGFMQGKLGEPVGGFPEPLRSRMLRGAESTPAGVPGAELPPADFGAMRQLLESKYPKMHFREVDLVSYALYPDVFEEYVQFQEEYGKVESLESRHYFVAPDIEEEVSLEIETGRRIVLNIIAISEIDATGKREVVFEVNGQTRYMSVIDKEASKTMSVRAKADKNNAGHVGAPMPGKVVSVGCAVGDRVEKGDNVATLSAMKMETAISAQVPGTVKSIEVVVNDEVEGGDLLITIEPEE